MEEAFPSLKLTEERVSIWAELLKDLTEEQFAKGVTIFCRDHCEIYPGTNVPAHIRKYGLDIEERDLEQEALLVFHGQARRFNPDAAAKASQIVASMSTGLAADRQWDEKRFIEAYVGLAK